MLEIIQARSDHKKAEQKVLNTESIDFAHYPIVLRVINAATFMNSCTEQKRLIWFNFKILYNISWTWAYSFMNDPRGGR